jgi:hypothetical protein
VASGAASGAAFADGFAAALATAAAVGIEVLGKLGTPSFGSRVERQPTML